MIIPKILCDIDENPALAPISGMSGVF